MRCYHPAPSWTTPAEKLRSSTAVPDLRTLLPRPSQQTPDCHAYNCGHLVALQLDQRACHVFGDPEDAICWKAWHNRAAIGLDEEAGHSHTQILQVPQRWDALDSPVVEVLDDVRLRACAGYVEVGGAEKPGALCWNREHGHVLVSLCQGLYNLQPYVPSS